MKLKPNPKNQKEPTPSPAATPLPSDSASSQEASAAKKKAAYDYAAVFYRTFPILLFVFSIFLFFSLTFPDLFGIAGRGVRTFFLGLFGPVAFLLPLLLCFGGVRLATDMKNGSLILKSISAILFLLSLSALFFTFGIPASEYGAMKLPPASFDAGVALRGGGLFGNLCGFGLVSLLSPVGAVLVFLLVLLFFLVACFNFDPKKAALLAGRGIRTLWQRGNERRAEAKQLAAAQEKAAAEKRAAAEEARRRADAEKKKAEWENSEERRRAAAFAEDPTDIRRTSDAPVQTTQRSSAFQARDNAFQPQSGFRVHEENEAIMGRNADNYPLDNDLFYSNAEKLTPLRPVKKSDGNESVNTSYGTSAYSGRQVDFTRRQKEAVIQNRQSDMDLDSPKTIEDFARITTSDTRTPPPPMPSSPAGAMQVKRETVGGFDVPPAPIRPVQPPRPTPVQNDVIEGIGGTVTYDDLPRDPAPHTDVAPAPFAREEAPAPRPTPVTPVTPAAPERPPFAPPYTSTAAERPTYTPPPSIPLTPAPTRDRDAGGNESFTAAELREGQARFSAETARPFGAPPSFGQAAQPQSTYAPPTQPQSGFSRPMQGGYGAPAQNSYAPADAPASAPVSEHVSYFRNPTPAAAPEEPKKRGYDFSSYRYPDISFLTPQDRANEAEMSSQVAENMERLIRTLQSYGVEAEPRSTTRGPRITRYEIVPALGVRINAITNLQNEIAMNLRAESLRIEAPIPGDSAIGIEVPNQTSNPVRLRALIDTEDFRNAQDKTTIALGADIAGKYVFSSISGMPHMLVAGATGMGKSVCINTIITSLLYKARPDEVRLILVDPKMVEFNIYQGIPHLLVPVINNAKQAVGALNWAAEEMDRRFSLISKAGARDLDGYNRARQGDMTMECLPRIVIVIDELNDLILSLKNSKPLDDVICRIAQKARAAGIHLLIGTQRPTVNVLTGNIKANISARIAFKVNQKVDSTTIIDAVGAEKLLDKGDMLFMKSSKTRRIQCCLVGEKEIEKVVNFLRANTDGEVYDESAMAGIAHATSVADQDNKGDASPAPMNEGGHISPDERKFWDAVDIAVQNGKAATSLLQRKLSIGYGRAAKLIDKMEELGIVSSADDKKAREVLLTTDEVAEMRARLAGRNIFSTGEDESDEYEE